MNDPIYRGLTANDLDQLIASAMDDNDLWGWYGDNQELDEHIERVAAANTQIKTEAKSGSEENPNE